MAASLMEAAVIEHRLRLGWGCRRRAHGAHAALTPLPLSCAPTETTGLRLPAHSVLLPCLFPASRALPATLQCLTASQVNAQALAITWVNAFMPTNCIEVDTGVPRRAALRWGAPGPAHAGLRI